METNWNQLIERYLQNELSEEGRMAFEQELQLNPSLREELEMHQLIQAAAKRASQRMLVKQTAKAHFRNLRIKQFVAGVVVTAGVTVGIVYLTQDKKKAETSEPKRELPVAELTETIQEEPTVQSDTIGDQINSTGDQAVLISGISMVMEKPARSTGSFSSVKTLNQATSKEEHRKEGLKTIPITFRKDSVPPPGKPTKVVGYTNEKLNGEVIQKSEEVDLSELYDSIGHFNDLYCGYALVMDNAKIGFIDRKGNIFIPLMYDEIIVTSNIQSSKNKHKRKGKKVLYIPKRSGSEVQYCEENLHPLFETDSNKVK